MARVFYVSPCDFLNFALNIYFKRDPADVTLLTGENIYGQELLVKVCTTRCVKETKRANEEKNKEKNR